MSTQNLKNEILRMVKEQEESLIECKEWPYVKYQKTIYDMANDTEWSFPAYLMLDGWWNDAIDWANSTEEEWQANILEQEKVRKEWETKYSEEIDDEK